MIIGVFVAVNYDNPSSPTPKKLNTKHTGIININLYIGNISD